MKEVSILGGKATLRNKNHNRSSANSKITAKMNKRYNKLYTWVSTHLPPDYRRHISATTPKPATYSINSTDKHSGLEYNGENKLFKKRCLFKETNFMGVKALQTTRTF